MTLTVHIETPRLTLRTATLADATHVASSWQLDAESITQTEAEDVIHRMQANHQLNTTDRFYHLTLAIIHKQTAEWIGWCGLDQRDPDRSYPVIFYLLKSAYWGKGLATEAASALLDYAFRELALEQVDGETVAENLASKRVMEKIGMHYLGLAAASGHTFSLKREVYLHKMNT